MWTRRRDPIVLQVIQTSFASSAIHTFILNEKKRNAWLRRQMSSALLAIGWMLVNGCCGTLRAAFMRQASFTGCAHDLFTDSDILSSLVPIIYSWQLYLILQRDADDNGRCMAWRRNTAWRWWWWWGPSDGGTEGRTERPSDQARERPREWASEGRMDGRSDGVTHWVTEWGTEWRIEWVILWFDDLIIQHTS